MIHDNIFHQFFMFLMMRQTNTSIPVPTLFDSSSHSILIFFFRMMRTASTSMEKPRLQNLRVPCCAGAVKKFERIYPCSQTKSQSLLLASNDPKTEKQTVPDEVADRRILYLLITSESFCFISFQLKILYIFRQEKP